MVSAATLFHGPNMPMSIFLISPRRPTSLTVPMGAHAHLNSVAARAGAGALRWRLVTTAGLEWEQIINHEEVGALTASAVVDAPGALRRLPIALF